MNEPQAVELPERIETEEEKVDPNAAKDKSPNPQDADKRRSWVPVAENGRDGSGVAAGTRYAPTPCLFAAAAAV